MNLKDLKLTVQGSVSGEELADEIFIPAEGETADEVRERFEKMPMVVHTEGRTTTGEFVPVEMEDDNDDVYEAVPMWRILRYNNENTVFYELYHGQLDMSFVFSDHLVLECVKDIHKQEQSVLVLMYSLHDKTIPSLYLLNGDERAYAKIQGMTSVYLDMVRVSPYMQVRFKEEPKNNNLN